MASGLAGLLVLNPDVVVMPVADLPDDTRAQIDHDPGDFALSRPQARTGSKVVDAAAAALVSRFAQPRTVSEAVILFARERQLDPVTVLEGAHPLILGLVEAGFLVPSGGDGAGAATGHAPLYAAGTAVLGGTVQRTLALLEDTELALLMRADGAARVLKIARDLPHGTGGGAALMAGRLAHEAAFLRSLDGSLSPRLFSVGTVDDRPYLEMEFLAGTDVATAAAEWRERDDEAGCVALLALLRRLARTYADLHARGVLHGDVHPRNVIVDATGAPRLVDFGVASAVTPGDLPVAAVRGGIPFFFEPELAAAVLSHTHAPASPAGEQYAVAAMLWFLATGGYCQQFRLGRDAMLHDIASGERRTFAECGARAWPSLEAVLGRALAKTPAERYPSMAALADALTVVALPPRPPGANVRPSRDAVEDAIARTSLAGPLWQQPLTPGPTASITYGAAGIALGLLHMASSRGDAQVLAAADLWTRRALGDAAGAGAFYNDAIQISPEIVGRASPFHGISGIHAVSALVAGAQADTMRQADAVHAFVASTSEGTVGLDVAVGQGSVVLGAALLLDALGDSPPFDVTPLRERGATSLDAMWQALERLPAIPEAGIDYAGIAHGWAGFTYAALLWCRLTGARKPAGLERRLDELARMALPIGRGVEWPWMIRRGSHTSMPGWCNGTAGFVLLWNLAQRVCGRQDFADLAERAAWHVWEAPDVGSSLCCGLTGRGYALLNHYRHTGDSAWLRRAEALGQRAVTDRGRQDEHPHSLYKGAFGAAVLLADLERPDDSAMPFFEVAGSH